MSFHTLSGYRWRCLAVSVVVALGSYVIGRSADLAELFAQCGQSCVGGCMSINGDASYLEYEFCTFAEKNRFWMDQAILAMSADWPAPGPNVQPMQDGIDNWTDDDPKMGTLKCTTLRPQEVSWFDWDATVQIKHTICPHE